MRTQRRRYRHYLKRRVRDTIGEFANSRPVGAATILETAIILVLNAVLPEPLLFVGVPGSPAA